MILLQILAFLAGIALIAVTPASAIKTFILPRGAQDWLTRLVFLGFRRLFELALKFTNTYDQRDRIMAFYAPISLLALLPVWYALVAIGYAAIFWALGYGSWTESFSLSGSSLFTLGFSEPKTTLQMVIVFSEAMLGLILVAMLIAYLPTMYAAFSRREANVTMLEVRAGQPPSAVEMILRYNRIHGLNRLTEQWMRWEAWFAEIEESHTTLAPLVFFRSPQPDHSWVTAAGAVLDAASLTLACIDIPDDPQAALCIRAGYLALRTIADFYHVSYNPNPHFPEDPIQIRREEFNHALEQLAAQGVPLKPDMDRAWQDYAGWRVNYDKVLVSLARLTMAPVAPWSSDRSKTNLAAGFESRNNPDQ
jgi:hypothetical protein